ncbi:MAG TPA: hypothetical protein ENH62_10875 [Marinobacter sp.]|uniref:Uncharacterized protein n=1 Tax=marine sediment metagenome TaxID=412755 RepID=A0A0F9NST7_9ZZZZ|nr:hypothetical protein [Marinobacter sp.]
MSEERMTVATVDICTCGIVMHQLDDDDYDTFGAKGPVCCSDCGNEKFVTVKQLQAENKRLREAMERVFKELKAGNYNSQRFGNYHLDDIYDCLEQALKGE